jgi:hypothetical protein
VRVVNRDRQRLCRQRRRSGLKPVTIALPMDVIIAAWKRREGLPQDMADQDLPWRLICEDLGDVLLAWAERWIRQRS